MSRRSKVGSQRGGSIRHETIWCWRRRIKQVDEAVWIERLRQNGCLSWALSESPGQRSILITGYLKTREGALALVKLFGGRADLLRPAEWLTKAGAAPLRIGSAVEIVHEKLPSRKRGEIPALCIPHGLAFGSGEHATTLMLLQALARHSMTPRCRVLDLGTGSGILALTARVLGARKIVATDFDADAIRTARGNEERNFSSPLIRWRKSDVRRLRAHRRYDLVIANLFSGILCRAAAAIADCVSLSGEVWLSGILREQKEEVVRAFEARGLFLKKAKRHGKWIMLRWVRAAGPKMRQADSQRSSRRKMPPRPVR